MKLYGRAIPFPFSRTTFFSITIFLFFTSMSSGDGEYACTEKWKKETWERERPAREPCDQAIKLDKDTAACRCTSCCTHSLTHRLIETINMTVPVLESPEALLHARIHWCCIRITIRSRYVTVATAIKVTTSLINIWLKWSSTSRVNSCRIILMIWNCALSESLSNFTKFTYLQEEFIRDKNY